MTAELAAVIADLRRRGTETDRRPTEVARVLAEAIEDGVWPAGALFPTDRELSETFGVSRAVVREAVACLKYDGIIMARPGIGTVVAKSPTGRVMRFAGRSRMSRREMRDLFEFRLQVEASSSELAAQHRTPFDLERIGATIERLEELIREGELGWEPDFEFHLAIAAATKNPYFQKFIDFIASNLRDVIQQGRAEALPARGRVLDEHRVIYEAIRAGDAGKARAAMVLHQQNSMIGLKLKPGTIRDPRAE